MGGEATRSGGASDADWTSGPAKWGGAGFLGGASLVGLVWVLGSREPAPMLDRAQGAIVIPADELDAPVFVADAAPTEPGSTAHAQGEPTNPPQAESQPEPQRVVLDDKPSLAPAPLDDQLPPESPLESRLVDHEPSLAPAPPDDEDLAPEASPDPALAVRIRVNSASPAELELLPGIGPVIAKRIAEDRAAHGVFKNLRDLQRVRGIGPKTAEKLTPHIRFD